VGDLAAIDAMVRRTTATFERIDVLVNNAASRARRHHGAHRADWTDHARERQGRVLLPAARGARDDHAQSGVIVNIASIAGKGYAGTSNAIYAASKGSVISLTRTAPSSSPGTTSTSTPCARAPR